MDLTLQQPGSHFFVRSASEEGIQVADVFYPSAILLSAHEIIPDWPVRTVDEIETAHLESILKLSPEVVLIGTGKQQVFLPPEGMMYFYKRNVGIEIMTTGAACRTFNVLVSESRNVVAALIPG